MRRGCQQRPEKSRISKQLSKQHGLCLSSLYSTWPGYEDLLYSFYPGERPAILQVQNY